MTTLGISKQSYRLTFLGLIAWLSVCLLVVGFFPEQVTRLGYFWIVAGLFGLTSSVGLSECVKSEIRAERELLTSYVNEARTDALTGLGNRRAFDVELTKWEPYWRKDKPVSLLLVDVDHFKTFNDTYGHQAGDEMLRSLAGVLRQKIEGIGTAIRYGGEEFAVLLPDTEMDEARMIAETLRGSVQANETHFRNSDLNVTVSIGLGYAQPSDSAKELFVRADEQLYAAKNAGRNCIRPEQPAVPMSAAPEFRPNASCAGRRSPGRRSSQTP
jgi:diguanylate cyclase